jgi:predicted Fe-Mo cluster-binding NifX family protein
VADAQEYRAHVFSSGVVLLALVGQMVGLPLDRIAALAIVVLIAKTGWELLVDGMRVLLDASLDIETLGQVRTILEGDPQVVGVTALTGRNAARTHVRYAAPLANATGTLSEHFGEAPYFALVTTRVVDGALERQEVLTNPFVEVPKAKGIRVAEWLAAQKTDVVLMKESLKGKGPEYVFGDAGVEMRVTNTTTMEAALAEVMTKGVL